MDNTEAVEKLAGILHKLRHSCYYEEQAQAILAAFQADPLAYVKPKPLEWEVYEWRNKEVLAAPTRVGIYVIDKNLTVTLTWEAATVAETISLDGCETLEAAQAAAYDDLCNRVKELF